MTTETTTLPLKILIGAAWLDGKVQPEEQDYLLRVARAHGVAEDAELKPLLHGLRSVTKAECYRWLEDYLGEKPSPTAWEQLMEYVGGLIYSDGEVNTEEARLLSQMQSQLHPDEREGNGVKQRVVKKLQTLYQQWMTSA
jgi:hypothetical protein